MDHQANKQNHSWESLVMANVQMCMCVWAMLDVIYKSQTIWPH